MKISWLLRRLVEVVTFFSGLLLFLVGFLATGFLTENLQTPWGFLVMFGGLALGIWALTAVQRRIAGWNFSIDVEEYPRLRTERLANSPRLRAQKQIRQVLLYVPSAIAAFTLFFLPEASHLAHPSSRYLPNYRIPIPWSVTVIPFPGYHTVLALFATGTSRLGVTPFRGPDSQISEASFSSIDPDSEYFASRGELDEQQQAAGNVITKTFVLGTIPFLCRQSPFNNYLWSVACKTPRGERQHNLQATFFGRAADIPVFYKIVEGIQPVK